MTSKLQEKTGSGENLGQYLQEIGRYPRLTPEQERTLALDCARGDENAVRQMVNSNLRLVVSVAREYAGRGVPLLDLIQEGSIGLLTAAKRFDPSRETRFSTYATKWIRQGVHRCLQGHGMIRIPTYTGEKMRKIAAARSSFLQEHGREPDSGELADLCRIPVQKLQKLLQQEPAIYSLDVSFGEDGDGFAEQLEDLSAAQPYEEMVRRELSQLLEALLKALTPRQQQVLRLRFGMDGERCSLEEAGRVLGISKERARQIEHEAMDKLQKMGSTMGLEEFLT